MQFDPQTLVALLTTLLSVSVIVFAFRRIKRRVRLERKISQAAGQVQSVDHEEAVQLLSRRPRDLTLDQTLFRFLPSLSRTRIKLRRAGLGIDVKVYVFILLMTVAGLLQVVTIPEITEWAQPLVLALGLHALVELALLPVLIEKRKSAMQDQLGQAVDYMARSISVGQSIETAILEAGHAVEQPLRDKFLMIHKLTEVGISLPNALATVAEDIDMAEFDFLVAAINAQIDSGGSITKSLRSIVDTLRARRNLKARVAALAAEGKMSAYILTCLPIGMFFYLQAVRPEYLAPLFAHPAALWILGGTALMIAFGFTAMLLIARIKV